MSKCRDCVLALVLTAALAAPTFAEPLGLGRPALPEEVAAWNVDVMPDGRGLPPGGMSVADGEAVYLEHCAVCHGDFAEGLDNWPKLAGGDGTLADDDPLKTVGSYWPHVSTVWDYIHRSMPFGQAQILTADQTYGIVAYILYSNYLVEDDFVLSDATFREVVLPNVDGFIVDDRPETEYALFAQEPCMENCKETVEITRRASNLDVTPGTGDPEPADAGQSERTGAGAAPSEGAPTEVAAAEPPAEAAVAPAAGSATAQAAPAAPPTAAEATTAAEAAAGEAAPVEAAAAADPAAVPDPVRVAAGEKVFNKCKACHMTGPDAKNRVGPQLNGIMDRAGASVPDFKYSPALADWGAAGNAWTDANLHAYLADPKGFIPKNKMAFAGLKKPEDIDAVIAYLRAHP